MSRYDDGSSYEVFTENNARSGRRCYAPALPDFTHTEACEDIDIPSASTDITFRRWYEYEQSVDNDRDNMERYREHMVDRRREREHSHPYRR